jgi:FkbM family methyltransferase
MLRLALRGSEEIKMNHALLKKILPRSIKYSLSSHFPSWTCRKHSYSQAGEDLLVDFVLKKICGSRSIRYLDIGAHHPFYLSNTALFYAAGGHGILVEPDPYFAKLLRSKRPRDTVLECGVHFSGENYSELFLLDPPTLNTLSRAEMERYVAMGHRLRDTIRVELKSLNAILDAAEPLDFMNLDIEGLDKAILDTVDWGRYRPACVCVETITYETQRQPTKVQEVIDLMRRHDYMVYADTFINTIFVDRHRWEAIYKGR